MTKHDIDEDIYEYLMNIRMSELEEFFNKNIKGQKYTTVVIGNKNEIDMDSLSKLGKWWKLI